MRGLLIISAIWIVTLAACVEPEVDYEPLIIGKEYSLEVANEVEVIYSDSSKLRVTVNGPELFRYIYKFKVEEEFPSGVHVIFYDGDEQPTAWLDAKYAKRLPTEKRIIARDSVVLYNIEGGRIESSELIWDERAKSLSTNRFSQIVRPPGDTIYSYGFKTNEDFTEYELFRIEGNMSVKDFDSSYPEEE
jgi:hypothetical protein